MTFPDITHAMKNEGVNEGVNLEIEGVIEGVNEGVKEELELLYMQIAKHPGKKLTN
ncbi:MAG: hypothetical protein Q8R96_06405 [Bacteroidota bacterium]|nr:hypothetical protein [Bacteroidota bacterium]